MMASGDAMPRLGELIKCPVCLEDMDEPRSLPCAHKVCKPCLQAILRNSADQTQLQCPTCRRTVQLESHLGIDGIPPDPVINQMREILAVKGAEGDCSGCKSANKSVKGDYYCQQCANYLCGECKQKHENIPIFAGHVLQERTVCLRHFEKDLEYFCVICKLFICSICILDSCSDHKCKLISSVDVTEIDSIIDEENAKFLEAVNTVEHKIAGKLTEAQMEAKKYFHNVLSEIKQASEKGGKKMKTHADDWKDLKQQLGAKLNQDCKVQPEAMIIFNKLMTKSNSNIQKQILEGRPEDVKIVKFVPAQHFSQNSINLLSWQDSFPQVPSVTETQTSRDDTTTVTVQEEQQDIPEADDESRENAVAVEEEAEEVVLPDTTRNDTDPETTGLYAASNEEATENDTGDTQAENTAEHNGPPYQNITANVTLTVSPTTALPSWQPPRLTKIFTIHDVSQNVLGFDPLGNILVFKNVSQKLHLFNRQGVYTNVLPTPPFSTPVRQVCLVPRSNYFTVAVKKKVHFQNYLDHTDKFERTLDWCEELHSITVTPSHHIATIGNHKYRRPGDDRYEDSSGSTYGLAIHDMTGRRLTVLKSDFGCYDIQSINNGSQLCISHAFNRRGLTITDSSLNGQQHVTNNLGYCFGLCSDYNDPSVVWLCDHSNDCLTVLSPRTSTPVLAIQKPVSVAIHRGELLAVIHLEDGQRVASVYRITHP